MNIALKQNIIDIANTAVVMLLKGGRPLLFSCENSECDLGKQPGFSYKSLSSNDF